MARKEGGGEEVLKELEVQRRPREEEEEEERGGLWRKLRLDWVKNWDQSCRTAVLLSRLQYAGRTRVVIRF